MTAPLSGFCPAHPRRWLAAAAILLLWVLAPASLAQAAPQEIEARVVSVRKGQIYLEPDQALDLKEKVRLDLKLASGERVRVTVAGVSRRFLLVERKADDGEGAEVTLEKGDQVKIRAELKESGSGGSSGSGGQAAPGDGQAPVVVGRAPTPNEAFGEAPQFQKVAFRNLLGAGPEVEPPVGEDGEPLVTASNRPFPEGEGVQAGELPPAEALPANEVSGQFALGVDAAYDERDDARDLDRWTPWARLRLTVDRLGGNERARLFFYGSVRQPFDGTPDWTGNHEEHLVARFSALSIEVDARAEDEVRDFDDRIELGIGRQVVPGVIEAGLIDGVRAGVRAGPLMFFGFGGFGVSPNPQREDYDSPIYGGGVRYSTSITHTGSFNMVVAGAQERFRGEGERDFLEARFDARWGVTGIRGAMVLDFFDALRDKRKTRLTTGDLSFYSQLSRWIRFEIGYRERRNAYQLDLVGRSRLNRDNTDPAIVDALALSGQRRSDLDPIVAGYLEHDERRNIWASFLFRFGDSGWDLFLRGEDYYSPEGRDATGFHSTLGKTDLLARDRFSIDFSVRSRRKGAQVNRDANYYYFSTRYQWFGDVTDVGGWIFYRYVDSDDLFGDTRLGLRGDFNIRFGEGVWLYNYVSTEVRRVANSGDGAAVLFGTSLSINF